MVAGNESASNPTTVEARSDLEVVVTRTFNAPARIVFEAWTTPELFRRWWVPKSVGIVVLSYEAEIRVGGGYRFLMALGDAKPMEFFGKYIEVTPYSRLVWTNDESGDDGAVTTVTFEEKGDKTLLVLSDRYRSKAARDAGLASGAYDGMEETFGQLDELIQG